MLSKTINSQSKHSSEIQEILSDFSQFYIVIMLSEGPIHGYGMIRAFKQRTGKTLSAGTLYPFLQNLESKAFVEKRDESTGKRPKIVYSLTNQGKRFCDRLFKRFAAITASALEPSLETCASCGAKIYEGAHHETIDGVMLAFCCVHCAKAFKTES
ncbi:MAG: PadR family transcriptional regulator [Candidatus Thorarchaeota archaeon]